MLSALSTLGGVKKEEINISKYYFTSRPLLESLPKDELTLLKKHLKLVRINAGKELFQEGSSPKAVYILKRGKVKIYQRNQNGEEQIVYIYTPGEVFGYRPLLCEQMHPTSAMTLEECGIYILSKEIFISILDKSTNLANILLRNLSHEFTVLVNHIAAFSQKSAKERIALCLLILQEKYRNDKPLLEISLSRADLASFAGTTIETVARVISKFKQQGFIQINGRKIIIADAQALHLFLECCGSSPS